MSHETPPRRWLERHTADWQADGLITADTREAILARYPVQPADPSRALIPLAVFTAGVGLVLLAVWNWERITDAIKLGATGALALTLYAGAWRATSRGSRWREAWWLAAPLGAWAWLAAVADARGWHDDRTLAFWCAAVAAGTGAASGGTLAALLGAGAPVWWLMQDGGGHLQWAFPLLFVLSALGVERAGHRAPAIVAGVALGVWAAVLTGTTYVASTPMPLAVLAAGAALVQWSRHPDGRRPAFARQTPGRVLMVTGLGFLLLATLHASSRDAVTGVLWHVRAGYRAWDVLTLVGGLSIVGAGVWPRVTTAATEARVSVAIVLAWFVAAGVNLLPHLHPWVWVTLASATLLACGSAWVREASRTRDRGTFALGVAAVIVLIGAHFTVNPGGANAWRGAAVLLISAAVLALAARRPTP